MGSFASPLSGLLAAQDQLQSVSNNLANIDTNGYKDQTLAFGDIFSQTTSTNGSGDPLQVGFGVQVASTDSNFAEGNLNTTQAPGNMALNGEGFFVTQGANGIQDYTRAGDFSKNSAGELTTPSGELLLGYPSVNGVVNTSAALQPMQVGNVVSPASASTSITVNANLSSTTAIGASGGSSPVAVFDSLGTQHNLTVSYTKTGANTWTYAVTVPSADITGGVGATTTVGSGTLNFNSSGVLTSTTAVTPISIPTLADGAASPLAIGGPFGTALAPTLTQTAAANGTSAVTTDGYASGSLSSFSVLPNGTIEGLFAGGNSMPLGQVAVATFSNVQGLARTGNNNYQPTASSGGAVVGVAGTGGRATVVGGAVEQSNVDIASEFAKLIVAQQAYSANAKSVTTFNQVSQATIAMLQ